MTTVALWQMGAIYWETPLWPGLSEPEKCRIVNIYRVYVLWEQS